MSRNLDDLIGREGKSFIGEICIGQGLENGSGFGTLKRNHAHATRIVTQGDVKTFVLKNKTKQISSGPNLKIILIP